MRQFVATRHESFTSHHDMCWLPKQLKFGLNWNAYRDKHWSSNKCLEHSRTQELRLIYQHKWAHKLFVRASTLCKRTNVQMDILSSERHVLLHSSSNVHRKKRLYQHTKTSNCSQFDGPSAKVPLFKALSNTHTHFNSNHLWIQPPSRNQPTLQRTATTRFFRWPSSGYWFCQEVRQLVRCANVHHFQLSLAHFVLQPEETSGDMSLAPPTTPGCETLDRTGFRSNQFGTNSPIHHQWPHSQQRCSSFHTNVKLGFSRRKPNWFLHRRSRFETMFSKKKHKSWRRSWTHQYFNKYRTALWLPLEHPRGTAHGSRTIQPHPSRSRRGVSSPANTCDSDFFTLTLGVSCHTGSRIQETLHWDCLPNCNSTTK